MLLSPGLSAMKSPPVATVLVMLGLVPSIHAFATASFSLPSWSAQADHPRVCQPRAESVVFHRRSSSRFAAGKTWMLGTSPSMTVERVTLAGSPL
ncbi:MAG TPA: hypothetical protein VLA85_19755, partial [Verrucomicrobiae bacterium]|nr:hypothetical protein [Verrucomicrobiae bacterium]